MSKRKTPEELVQVQCFQGHVHSIARILSDPTPDAPFQVYTISAQMRDLSVPTAEEDSDLWYSILALSPPLTDLFDIATHTCSLLRTDMMLRCCTNLASDIASKIIEIDPLCNDVVDLVPTTATSSGGTRVHAPDRPVEELRDEFLVLRSFLAAFICLYTDLLKQAAADGTEITDIYPCYKILCWFLLHPHLSEPDFPSSALHPPQPVVSPLTLVTRQLNRASNPFLLLALRGIASLHVKCQVLPQDLIPHIVAPHVDELILLPEQRVGNLMGLSMIARVLPCFLQGCGIFHAIGHAVQRIVEGPEFTYPSFLQLSAILSILTGLAHHTHVQCGFDQCHIMKKVVLSILAVECCMRMHAPAEFVRKFSLVPAVCAFLRQTKRNTHLTTNAAVNMLTGMDESLRVRVCQVEKEVFAEVMLMRSFMTHGYTTPAWLDAASHQRLARSLSDMAIVTAARTYRCHKIHVLHHSPMLYRRFTEFTSEPLPLADMNDMAFELVLQWMYAGFIVHMSKETTYEVCSEPELVLFPRAVFPLYIGTADALTVLSVAVYLGVESLVCYLTETLIHPDFVKTEAALLREFAYDNQTLPQSVQILHTLYGKSFAATCMDKTTAAATILYAESQCLFRDDAGLWTDTEALAIHCDALAHK